ncbi:MAG: DNA polymerase III subunit alpha, partial [Bacilli bacterium]|nr:DNA polymerase III subunit alpha [Bacilli bacterium]
MDLLGLRNLSIIENCIKLVEYYEGIKLDPYKLPYEDEEAIKLINKNKTMGLFQLESPGMKRTIADVKPSNFEDVAAIEALFRPGPMDSIPSFARRKNGLERIEYLTPELEPILKNTYGIIVYQEQIMQIVRSVAGFSYGEADIFRRAISKKDAAKLKGLKDKFINGCITNGKNQSLANKLFDLIERFANYGFNKSHAVSYAVLTCQMAYLKARFPKEFYCSILDTMPPGDRKFRDTLNELKGINVSLSVPDINKSYGGFVDAASLEESKIKGDTKQNINNSLITKNKKFPNQTKNDANVGKVIPSESNVSERVNKFLASSADKYSNDFVNSEEIKDLEKDKSKGTSDSLIKQVNEEH